MFITKRYYAITIIVADMRLRHMPLIRRFIAMPAPHIIIEPLMPHYYSIVTLLHDTLAF